MQIFHLYWTMGNSQDFPTDREASSTTGSVADLIAALLLPSIEPLGSDIDRLSALPRLPIPDARAGSRNAQDTDASRQGHDVPRSQLEAVRRYMDECFEGIAGLKKHQNQSAALAAILIERLHSFAELEGGILGLDRWQRRTSLAGMEAELAAALQLPEGVAAKLAVYASTVVRKLPATLARLQSGELGWEQATIIAEESTLLTDMGVAGERVAEFELLLLDKAQNSTVPSFREKSRRLRERRFPESLVPRTRKAYAERMMTKSRSRDGMSWLSLYAPAPTVEGIWDQCTATAQAAQGPHEDRTLTQLRVDVAAALLLNQTLSDNQIFAPPPDSQVYSGPPPATAATSRPEYAGTAGTTGSAETAGQDSHIRPGVAESSSTVSERRKPAFRLDPLPKADSHSRATNISNTNPTPNAGSSSVTAVSGSAPANCAVPGELPFPQPVRGENVASGGSGPGLQKRDGQVSNQQGFVPEPRFWLVETDPCNGGSVPDSDRGTTFWAPWQVPVFDDPDYWSPAFREPDPRNEPDWLPHAKPPVLEQYRPARPPASTTAGRAGGREANAAHHTQWPPLPKVLPVITVPVLSMLGLTDEPGWMEGAGPISMEVARQLISESSSMYRLLVDPITNQPLDSAPERYRVTKAMSTALRIRDEYCQFPGCMAKASTSHIDHIEAFDGGGTTTFNNVEALCLHHHLIKHFRDDKTRSGHYRTDQSPERRQVSLRGWVPRMTETGRVSWTSPTGCFYPADTDDRPLPLYPAWLQRLINQSMGIHYEAEEDGGYPDPTQTYDQFGEVELPVMPEIFHLDEFEEAQLLRQAIARALENPALGLADAV